MSTLRSEEVFFLLKVAKGTAARTTRKKCVSALGFQDDDDDGGDYDDHNRMVRAARKSSPNRRTNIF